MLAKDLLPDLPGLHVLDFVAESDSIVIHVEKRRFQSLPARIVVGLRVAFTAGTLAH